MNVRFLDVDRSVLDAGSVESPHEFLKVVKEAGCININDIDYNYLFDTFSPKFGDIYITSLDIHVEAQRTEGDFLQEIEENDYDDYDYEGDDGYDSDDVGCDGDCENCSDFDEEEPTHTFYVENLTINVNGDDNMLETIVEKVKESITGK